MLSSFTNKWQLSFEKFISELIGPFARKCEKIDKSDACAIFVPYLSGCCAAYYCLGLPMSMSQMDGL